LHLHQGRASVVDARAAHEPPHQRRPHWAALANGNGIDLDAMVWDMVEAVDEWPEGEPL
jgi:hypothetical protein